MNTDYYPIIYNEILVIIVIDEIILFSKKQMVQHEYQV